VRIVSDIYCQASYVVTIALQTEKFKHMSSCH